MLALLLLAAAAQDAATVEVLLDVDGRLAPEDPRLARDEHYDEYEVDVAARDVVTITMTSAEFDAYAVAFDTAEAQHDNDDADPGSTDSRLELTMPASGRLRIWATSFRGGETGAYHLRVVRARVWADWHDVDGFIEETDEAGADGRWRDSFTWDAPANLRLQIRLESADLDPLLEVTLPDGSVVACDDADGLDSVLTLTPSRAGALRVTATTAFPGATGAYRLVVRRQARN